MRIYQKAKYVRDYVISLEFNDVKRGKVDLKDIIYNYEVAKPLRNLAEFRKFRLDSWPTLAWECGFDIAPPKHYMKNANKAN